MIKITISLLLVLSVFLSILYFYLENRRDSEAKQKSDLIELSKKFNSKNTLIVGNDSLGASTRSESFGSIISCGFKTYLNFSSPLIFNKTFSFRSMLKHNLSLAEIKGIQSLSTQRVKENLGILNFMINSSEMQKEYEISKYDCNTRISSLLKNSNMPYFVITTGANDIMHSLNADPISLVLDKEKRTEALEKINSSSIKKISSGVVSNVKSVVSDIKEINPNTKIVVLGLYVPSYIQFFEKIYGNNYITDLIEQYNRDLQCMCIKNDIKYVDISCVGKHAAFLDFHPNKSGQLIIARKVLTAIATYECSIAYFHDKAVTFDNEGLIGILNDAQLRLDFTKERTDLTKRDKTDKINEYTDEIKIIEEVMQPK